MARWRDVAPVDRDVPPARGVRPSQSAPGGAAAGAIAVTDRGRIEYAAIADAMAPTLTLGRLAWAPIASGRAGELGFTVGKAAFTAARAEDSWRSTYATIWRHQADGRWKALFDTGRIIQDL